MRLAESNPEWAREFERLAADLRAALGDAAVSVEHVGSTAVPGLAAKPIVDIAVGLSPNAVTKDVIRRLEAFGYEHRGDAGDEGGLIFVLETVRLHRIAHVHAVLLDDPQLEAYVRFRDTLREDADHRAAYADLKRRLAEEFPSHRRAYSEAKDSFIAGVLKADRCG